MINFFRKIRKNLLQEGKTIRYFKYAIGEIILVVIGILIALQINSYKNYKDDRKTERKLLLKLKVDLQKDSLDLNLLLSRKMEQLEGSNSTLTFFNNPDQALASMDTVAFRRNIVIPFNFYYDNPNKTAFEMAIRSGDFYKITNDSLVDLLATYYSDIDLSTYLLTTKDFTTDYTTNVMMKKYNFKGGGYKKFFKSGYFKDFEIENYYNVFNIRVNVGISLIQQKIDKNINLMKLIDAELARDDFKV